MVADRVYAVFETAFGWCGMVGDHRRIFEIIPFLDTETEVFSRIVSTYGSIAEDSGCFEVLREAIENYCEGENVLFRFSPDLSRSARRATPFSRVGGRLRGRCRGCLR